MAHVDVDASTILFVCTGNVCRSPYMEYRLRDLLATGRASGVPLASAGTRALEGHAMADPLVERLLAQGIDASDFRAAQLTEEALHRAGAVVTATREHRSHVVKYGGNELAERTFTLAQLSRLLGAEAPEAIAADPVGRDAAAGLVLAALAMRGRGAARPAEDDDLDDPWRRSRRTYRRVADRIDDLLIPIAARLTACS